VSPLRRLRVHRKIVITKTWIAREVLTFNIPTGHVRGMKSMLLVLTAWFWVACDAKVLQPHPDNGDAAADSDADNNGDHDVHSEPTSTVHYIGRFDERDTLKPRADWSGTSVFATFTGTGIAARIDGAANYFEVFIDGHRASTQHFTPATGDDTSKSLMLASGLANAQHTVQLFRRTEAFNNPTMFLGFSVTGGALVPTTYPFHRRIEVIGDSISAGYGVEGDRATCGYSQETQDATDTYVAIAARDFNAALSMVVFSGKGMYRDLDFDMSATMPKIYDRTLYNDADNHWSYTSYVPDVIVINLGTNDYANGNPGTPFTETYIEFMSQLRALYPAAEIFCVAGGMQNADVYVQAVQAAVTGANDEKVHFVAFDHTTADELGCDYHPNSKWNSAMADVLENAISAVTGW
jgi:lysophospholipase L1-like esterase